MGTKASLPGCRSATLQGCLGGRARRRARVGRGPTAPGLHYLGRRITAVRVLALLPELGGMADAPITLIDAAIGSGWTVLVSSQAAANRAFLFRQKPGRVRVMGRGVSCGWKT
jgi:hypothetical protein